MKFKVLSRSDADWSGRNDGTPNEARSSKNVTASLHPPKRPLDLQRAMTASKITRNLARPFLFACAPSHIDGVYALTRSRSDMSFFASAAADGEVRLWNMATRSPSFSITPTPAAFIRGITFSHDSERLLFCSDAKFVYSASVTADYAGDPSLVKSLTKYECNAGPPASISARYDEPQFATASSSVQIWDESRSSPLSTLSVSHDSIHCVRYNPVERNIIASAGHDRAISFFDVRANTPIRRLVLSNRTNDICWNPMEAMSVVIANDDHNCYTYDMRNFTMGASYVHKDHTSAVMSVDFSPTGQEIVTGSYDKTLRIFRSNAGRSREVYHTKRMQRVFAVSYSLDGGYIISGSDDGDVRVWKSERGRPMKPLFHSEKAKMLSSEKLIERYRYVDDVRKIAMKRRVPSHVKVMTTTKKIMKASQMRKDQNARLNSSKGPVHVPDRSKNIVRELP